MNIEPEIELIASLESAGELSIKERRYLKLAKAYLQLAAENVGQKAAISAVNRTAEECELNGDELKYVVEPSEFEALTDLLDETPSTDAYMAGIKADGVEEFAKHCDESIGFVEPEGEELYTLMEEQARDFAKQLREGAK